MIKTDTMQLNSLNSMTDQAQPPAGGTPPPPPPPPPPPSGGGTPPPPPPPSGQQPQGGAQPVQPQQPQQAPQTPPPRPGDNVPQGGLDPTQVFSAPPTQPQAAQPQDGAQPPAGGQPQPQDQAQGAAPKDQGPPPPPPGPLPTDDQLKAQGYDDEDIRVLKEVGDYRFGSITSGTDNSNITVPQHPETQFDEQLFLSLLRGSISLTRDEKWRIIQAIPKLSQFQIDELQKILDEEKRKFAELSPKHLLQLQKLEQKHTEDWRDLQSLTVQQGAREEEAQQADEIRKQLGL